MNASASKLLSGSQKAAAAKKNSRSSRKIAEEFLDDGLAFAGLGKNDEAMKAFNEVSILSMLRHGITKALLSNFLGRRPRQTKPTPKPKNSDLRYEGWITGHPIFIAFMMDGWAGIREGVGPAEVREYGTKSPVVVLGLASCGKRRGWRR